MFVVADTTPLNYLVRLGQIDLLPMIYGRVILPSSVLRELNHPRTPPEVLRWSSQLPVWCEVRHPQSIPDRVLSQLDAGERDAIQIALDGGFDTVLMDEMKGRLEAQIRGLRVAGTIPEAKSLSPTIATASRNRNRRQPARINSQ